MAAAILAVAWGDPARAATCSVSASGVNFGSYDPLADSDADASGTIRLTCDEPTIATVTVEAASGSPSARAMSNGASRLAYNVYTSSQRTVMWGDGSGGSAAVTVQGSQADHAIYGTIPARQPVTAGMYQDTLIVTVSY